MVIEPCKSPRRWAIAIVLLACLLGPMAVTLEAQGYLQAIGVPPYTTALPVENGYLNASNGNLHLEIPLGTFLQRGKVPEKIVLAYDGAIWGGDNYYGWYPDGVKGDNGGTTWGGWRILDSAQSGFLDVNVQAGPTCGKDGTENFDKYTNWFWTAPDGTSHPFQITTEVGNPNACGSHSNFNILTGDSLAIDGTGYHMHITNGSYASVYAPDGTLVFNDAASPGGGSPMDTNGNYLTAGILDSLKSDTMGRQPLITTVNGDTVYYDVLNSQGGRSRYTVTLETINVHTNFGILNATEYSGTITVIQSIALPDGTSYSFTYDEGTTPGHYGTVASMTLPTGGVIQYTFANYLETIGTGEEFLGRWLQSRTTPDGNWTYTLGWNPNSCPALGCVETLTVTKPNNDNAVYTILLENGEWLTGVQYYSGAVSQADLVATLSQTYDFSKLCQSLSGSPLNCTYGWPIEIHKLTSTTTLPIPAGQSLSQTTQFAWDASNYGNVLTRSDWNFYTGSLPSTPDRITKYTYLPPYTGSNNNNTGANIVDHVASMTVTSSSGATVSQTNYFYDQTPPASASGIQSHDDADYPISFNSRGNLTQVQQLVSGTSNYLNTYKKYDMTGNVVQSTDSNNNPTTYSYADNLFTDAGDSLTPVPFTPTAPTNAYAKTVTQGSLVTTFGYYWGKGQKAVSTDANLQTTYFHLYDPLDRPTSAKRPDGGWTYSVYPSGSETQIDTGTGITSGTLATNCPTSSSACRHDETLFDGLGRVASKILVSDPIQQIIVATGYDSDGRVQKVSNPYRTTSDSTYGWEMPTYDGLNRTVKSQQADGSSALAYYGTAVATGGGLSSQLCSSSSYGLGYPVLKVDEAGKKRQSWIDGFGRLIEVDEPNPSGTLSVATCYSYDLNNNLIGAAQGTQTRSFAYDLLSRSTATTNPESGTTNYYYTTSGGSLCSGDPSDVCRRTDANGVTTTYTYDGLNRLTSKAYSDLTPAVTYSYDQATCIGKSPCYNKGRRTGMTDAAGSESWSYDTMGRVWGDSRTTNGKSKISTYLYNLDGSLNTLTYPSGTHFSYSYNAAAQLIAVSDQSNTINYATGGYYSPSGDLMALSNSTLYNSTIIYNSRLQPCWVYATNAPTALPWNSACSGAATTGAMLDLKYNFSLGAGDNGNVVGIANDRDGTRSQAFTYDQIDRISTGQTTSTYSTSPAHCWGELFQYDQWGNLLSIGVSSSVYNGCTQESLSVMVNGSNQISSPSGYMYDLAGNLKTVPAPAAASYTYNAEHEMTTAAGVTYAYDGDGRRVQKSNGKLYWYGGRGEVLDETDLSGTLTSEYVYFGGRRIARRDWPSNQVYYYFQDHLGTSRSIVQSGQTSPCYEADFYPFGGERTPPIANTCAQNYKFTGKERDVESNLDNFEARYFASTIGRFTSPDPSGIGSSRTDPQSWNMYAYARNNPLKYIDPEGETYRICVDGICVEVSDEEFDQAQQTNGEGGLYLKNGGLYYTDQNGNQVLGGTYSQTDVDLSFAASGTLRRAGIVADNGVKAGALFMAQNAVGGAAGHALGLGLEALGDAAEEAAEAADAAEAAGTAEKPASTPVGRSGSELKVPKGTNEGTEIGGRYYTGHALDSMQGRGLVPSVVEDTIDTGIRSPGNTPGTIKCVTDQAAAIINESGDVVTAYPK